MNRANLRHSPVRLRHVGLTALVTLATLAGGLVGCSGAPSSEDDGVSVGAALTDVPVTPIRDQNTDSGEETNNCWLYTTTAWVESLQLAQQKKSGALVFTIAHLSVSYFDYWDWYAQITTGKTNTGDKMDPDGLDGGGEWGDVADMMLARGVVHDTDFLSAKETTTSEADAVYAAAKAMAKSLTSGALKSASARSNGATVRAELDKAFKLSSSVQSWMTANFGADGKTTLASGTSPMAPLMSTDDVQVLAPHPDGTSEIVKLTDALGTNAGRNGADGKPNSNLRTGQYAWGDAEFTKGSDAANRAYFIRLQKALNAGVAVPFGWFWAMNSDPDGVGLFKGKPTGSTNSDDSTGHYTLAVDYQATGVPGYGTLPVGIEATDDAKNAALSTSASVQFIKIKDSEPYKNNVAGTGYSELYMTYLLSSDRVYDKSTKKYTTEKSMMSNVILPPGF